ncbi:MAG: hypothetical protein OFPI_12520 [Osedax symbiont Rs2]|nr:MAG: hypothetical protein OFPI_12520 [Osedax symbiont Rs2]
MGFGGVSLWQLAIVLGIVVLLFGTKKLRNIGGDLGSAVKGFKKAMSDGVLTDNKDADTKTADKSIEKQDADFVESVANDAATENVAVTEDKSEKKSS